MIKFFGPNFHPEIYAGLWTEFFIKRSPERQHYRTRIRAFGDALLLENIMPKVRLRTFPLFPLRYFLVARLLTALHRTPSLGVRSAI